MLTTPSCVIILYNLPYKVLGPFREVHGFIVIGKCGCVACNFEAWFVVIDVDTFGHDFGTFGVEVRHTSTLHRSGVSAVRAE